MSETESTFETLFKKWRAGDKSFNPLDYVLTHDEIDELFRHHDFVVVRYPANQQYDGRMTIYRNSDPDRWMRVSVDDFLKKPNKLFPKDGETWEVCTKEIN